MNQLRVVLCAGIVALTATACSSSGDSQSSGVSSTPSSSTTPVVTAAPMPKQFVGHALDNPDSMLSKRKVYFEFDLSELNSDGMALVQAHADYLVANPAAKVSLEGHADERGTREYNMGLGERRSNTVSDVFLALGVSNAQVSSVSYGEEQPASDCHDESCWSQNRRVEIVYTSR